jgi:hypothetical protein
MNPARSADGPTYLLDSSTLIALQLKEPFNPLQLALPKFYQRPLEQDPVPEEDDPDKKPSPQESKVDPGIVRALVSRVTIEERLDATDLCLGMAHFQLHRHLLNPSLLPEDLLGTNPDLTDDSNGAPPTISTGPHWVNRVTDTLYRFTAILSARNQTHTKTRETPGAATEPAPEILEQRQQALRLAKELAHHVQLSGDKELFRQIHTGANLYQEKEIDAWLQPNEEQKREKDLIFHEEEIARQTLQAIGPEEIDSETAQQAMSHIENAHRYRDRTKPHRLVWEPYHLLTLLGPNVYVISTNPVCDSIIRLIKQKDLPLQRYGIQSSYLDNLTEISSQKYMLKTLVPMKTKTLEKRIERTRALP